MDTVLDIQILHCLFIYGKFSYVRINLTCWNLFYILCHDIVLVWNVFYVLCHDSVVLVLHPLRPNVAIYYPTLDKVFHVVIQ